MNLILSFIFLLTSLPHIKETLPDTPFAYAGLNPREIITVDPQNSPLLEKGYQELLLTLSNELSEKEILFQVADYVGQTLFDLQKCSDHAVYALIHQHANGQLEPEIPLEIFLAERVGVCRHIALATTYIVNRLIKEGHLQGEAFLVRDYVRCGRHAWTLFLSKEGAWHIDAYWRILEDGKTEEGYEHLSRVYGPNTMERQQQRWSHAH